jgi:hypothetical protein
LSPHISFVYKLPVYPKPGMVWRWFSIAPLYFSRI